jgi:hypothetical protein
LGHAVSPVRITRGTRKRDCTIPAYLESPRVL